MYKKNSRCTIVDYMRYALATYLDEYYNIIMFETIFYFLLFLTGLLYVMSTPMIDLTNIISST